MIFPLSSAYRVWAEKFEEQREEQCVTTAIAPRRLNRPFSCTRSPSVRLACLLPPLYSSSMLPRRGFGFVLVLADADERRPSTRSLLQRVNYLIQLPKPKNSREYATKTCEFSSAAVLAGVGSAGKEGSVGTLVSLVVGALVLCACSGDGGFLADI